MDSTKDCESPEYATIAVLRFLAINIVAHVLTMPPFPGQKLQLTIIRVCLTLLNPLASILKMSNLFCSYTLGSVSRWRKWPPPDTEKREDMHPSEAVGSSANDAAFPFPLDGSKAHGKHGEFILCTAKYWASDVYRRTVYAFRGHTEQNWLLQAAIQAGAVATLQEHEAYSTIQVAGPFWTLRYDGTCVQEKDGPIYRVNTRASISTEIQFPPSSSWVQVAVAFLQLVYSSFELYEQYESKVKVQGLSSPYIMVIPYIVGSGINMLLNLFIKQYPYILVLPTDSDSTSSTKLYELHLNERDDGLARVMAQLSPFIGAAILTGILLPITHAQFSDPLTATSLLCWTYSGVACIPAGFAAMIPLLIIAALSNERLLGQVANFGLAIIIAPYSPELLFDPEIRYSWAFWSGLILVLVLQLGFFLWGISTMCRLLWDIYRECPT